MICLASAFLPPSQISLHFAEGLKTFVRSLAFGLPRHAANELVEHGERCIGQGRFQPDDSCDEHGASTWKGQFSNMLHRRAQAVGRQSLESGHGNAPLPIWVDAELANESQTLDQSKNIARGWCLWRLSQPSHPTGCRIRLLIEQSIERATLRVC
jgi:hypothetical protein